jgi:hypothetical protein
MDIQSFHQQTARAKFPKAQISGNGPHGVVVRFSDHVEVVLHAEFSDARTLADISGGRLVFLPKPVACLNQDFGYRERAHGLTATGQVCR